MLPYGFVLIKEIPEHWEVVKEMLEEYTFSERGIEKFKDTGVILLDWYRCFGWADFIAIVWSPNVERIKEWIIKFRDDVKSRVGGVPLTTTIIGIHEDEHKEMKSDIDILKKIIEKHEREIIDEYTDIIRGEFNIERLKKFLRSRVEKLEKIKKILEEKY